MQKEKLRVYALARELNMESKDLLDLCRQHGLDVKNQLSNLEPEQVQAIQDLVRKGGGVAVAAPPAPKTAQRGVNLDSKVRTLHAAKPIRPAGLAEASPESAPLAPAVSEPVTESKVVESTPPPERPAAVVETPPTLPPQPPTAPKPAGSPRVEPAETPAAAAAAQTPTNVEPAGRPGNVPTLRPPTILPPRPASLSQTPRTAGGNTESTRRQRPIPRPPSHHRPLVATPPPSLKPMPTEEKKPVQPTAQKKFMELPDAVKRGEQTITDVNKLIKEASRTPTPVVGDVEAEDDDRSKVRPGRVAGRVDRHANRVKRAEERKGRSNETTKTLLEDDDSPVRTKIKKKKLHHQKPTEQRKEKVVLVTPITVRAFCEATGLRAADVVFRLKDLGQMASINSTIDPDTAELIIVDRGLDVEIRRQQDVETKVLAEQDRPDRPEDMAHRAPIVTIMGHVDHGKTTLLDQIRKSDVAATEAGGITQVLRAWRVEHGGRPITFLDTPGHEAFTKMRARGANVTDIAVIVVAADDGVMPQTEEAISHAKAAGVSLIVAINKVDLPNANVRKTEQQLYSLGLVPDNMGGDVPFVHTSGAKGTGIDKLLDTISLVAELKELKANPTKPARGTVLEAMLSEGEGVLATLLVRDGTLHRGDVIFCGAAFGRVRALYNDLGHPIEEAGPSVPVRIAGLDVVPNADDSFQVISDLSLAREIAENRRVKQQEATMKTRAPVRLETLNDAKIAELKVILKADFRGSIEAISKELQKLQHDEVRVHVLHTGIGAITESDVDLALASPEDTIIVGFNVVPDDNAISLADDRGIQIREYDIIYKLTEDIRAALEGKLKPREEIVHLGRAVVRETFKISRVGTIAGCHVTQGVIERSSKVRIIRQGVVIYPPADRSVGLDSLKRFKEDVREVREGFECGLKVSGYDDIKVDDLIEAYRIEQVQRTL